MAAAEMTRSATEQPLVPMGDETLAAPATEEGLLQSNPRTAPAAWQWEIQVEFKNNMWWAMPQDLSNSILEEWRNGSQQVSFIWDWHNSLRGSYQPNGQETIIDRYIIDFTTMKQRNLDNDRTQQTKVVVVIR